MIQYYRSAYDSKMGKELERISREAEVIIWEMRGKLKKGLEDDPVQDPQALQENKQKINKIISPILEKIDPRYKQKMQESIDKNLDSIISNAFFSTGYTETRKIIRATDLILRSILLGKYGEKRLRDLSMFWLRSADFLHQCADYDELLINEGKNKGELKLYADGRLTPRGLYGLWIVGVKYFRHLFTKTGNFFPLCDRNSANRLFGKRFSDSFFYLRTILYCDKFIVENYGYEGGISPLYRLESIIMVATKTEFEYNRKDSIRVLRKRTSHSEQEKMAVIVALKTCDK